MKTPEEIRAQIAATATLDPELASQVAATRFDHVPQRLQAALSYWPLDLARVLDVGCAYGQCLAYFGPGSVGVDHFEEAVTFAQGIGLDVVSADVEVEGAFDDIEGDFEYVWVSDMLEHLEAPRLLLRAVAPKIGRGGALLLHSSVLPRSRVSRALLRRMGERPFDAEVHYHQWTIDTLRHLLARSGYRVVRIAPVLPARLHVQRAPVGLASRVIVEAVPDADLEARVRKAERRNREPDAA